VQTGAASGIGFTDADYQRVGARIVPTAREVFALAEMIVKVKEPQPEECAMLSPSHVLYTYLHLAPDPKQTEALIRSGATCIAYETVTAPDGSLPLLTPMSEVAGRMSVQVGAYCLAEGERRPRHPARRRARRGAGQGRDPRRRRVGHARGRDGGRPARRRHGGGPLGEAAARAVGHLRALAAHGVLHAGTHRRARNRRRSRDRSGADRRSGCAEARDARHGASHEGRRGASSTSPSTRAAASRPARRRRTRSPPTWWTT